MFFEQNGYILLNKALFVEIYGNICVFCYNKGNMLRNREKVINMKREGSRQSEETRMLRCIWNPGEDRAVFSCAGSVYDCAWNYFLPQGGRTE